MFNPFGGSFPSFERNTNERNTSREKELLKNNLNNAYRKLAEQNKLVGEVNIDENFVQSAEQSNIRTETESQDYLLEHQFDAPDLEKAKENSNARKEAKRNIGYPWIKKAEEVKKTFIEQADDIYKQMDELKESKSPQEEKQKLAEKYSEILNLLKDKWQRFKVLSSEELGAKDTELNALARNQIFIDVQNIGDDISYNDAARTKLLEQLRQQISIDVPRAESLKPDDVAVSSQETAPIEQTASSQEIAPQEIAPVEEVSLQTGLAEEEKAGDEKEKTAEQAGPEKPKGEAYVVDVSEYVKAYALRLAEQKLNDILYPPKEERQPGERRTFGDRLKGVGRGIANFGKKIWVRLGEEGYRQKFYREQLQNIQNDKDLLAGLETRILKKSQGRGTVESKKASQEVLDSVIEEFEKKIVEADEKGEIVNDPNVNQTAAELFYGWATGAIASREEFDQQVEEKIMPLVKASGRQFTNEQNRKGEAAGLMYANNFFQLAESYKSYLQNEVSKLKEKYGEDQEQIIKDEVKAQMALDIQLGLKQKDLYETKPLNTLKWYEKLVDATERIPILNKILANPVSYGVLGGVVGTFAGKGAARMAAGAGLVTLAGVAPWLAPLILGFGFGGLYAGMRRSRDLAHDRGFDLRRSTLGAESEGRRTAKMREFQYDTLTAEGLTAELQAMLQKSRLTDDDKGRVAEITARLQLERERSVDLIGVQGAEGSKHGTKAVAMKDLKIVLGEVKNKHDLGEEQLRDNVEQLKTALGKMVDERDRAFGRYKAAESVKAGVFGALMGLAGGAVAQEAGHEVMDLAGHEPKGETALQHLFHVVKGDKTYLSDKLQSMSFEWPGGAKTDINIPEGTSLRADGGYYDLVDARGKVVFDNIEINKDGFTPDTIERLRAQGFDFKDNVTTTQKMSSSLDDLKEKFHLGKHPRIEWHDEPGKRYSSFFNKAIEFEGKQQMLYLNKDANGAVYVDAKAVADNLIKNVEDAFKEFGTNPDGSVDHKLLHIKDAILDSYSKGTLNEHLQAVIIPTEEASKEGVGALVQGATVNDYHLGLPKEVSDLFTTEQSLRYLHHPVKYIELRFDNHVLATTIGGDMPPVAIAQAIHHPVILPPPASGWDVPPVMPFFPRRALEPAAKKGETAPVPEAAPVVTPPSYFYGYGAGESSENAWERRRNGYIDSGRIYPGLVEDPTVHLDTDEVSDWYFGQQKPEYLQELEQMIEKMPPMDDKCRMAICIPVADWQEKDNIKHTLEQYYTQIDKERNKKAIDPSLFEIVLFLNHPSMDWFRENLASRGKGAQEIDEEIKKTQSDIDKTISEIKDFQSEKPELKVRVFNKEFPERVPYGQIIKYAYDLACLRTHKREKPEKEDVIIVTNDADLRDISLQYVKLFIEEFDKNENENIDYMLGKRDMEQSIYEKYPTFHTIMRFGHYLEALSRSGHQKPWEVGIDGKRIKRIKDRDIQTQGRSTAMRSSIYEAVGGVDAGIEVTSHSGADVDMGYAIEAGRNGKWSGKYLNAAWLETDPRREINGYKNGRPLALLWDDWTNPDVRNRKWSEEAEKEGVQELNFARIEHEVNLFVEIWFLDGENKPFPEHPRVKQALNWLGIKNYAIEEVDGRKQIRIADPSDPFKPRDGVDVSGLIKDLSTFSERMSKVKKIKHRG